MTPGKGLLDLTTKEVSLQHPYPVTNRRLRYGRNLCQTPLMAIGGDSGTIGEVCKGANVTSLNWTTIASSEPHHEVSKLGGSRWFGVAGLVASSYPISSFCRSECMIYDSASRLHKTI